MGFMKKGNRKPVFFGKSNGSKTVGCRMHPFAVREPA